jgi:hypothetical protein
MPTVIVPAPSPPPVCNLAPRDVEQFVPALAAYHASLSPPFADPNKGCGHGFT